MGRTRSAWAGRERKGRRRVVAGGVIACVAATASVCIAVSAKPAGASPAPHAWVPVARDVRHADGWVLAGEQQSMHISRTQAPVLFVGDSITQWWQRYGATAWEADFAPLGAADDGVAGDTTSNVLARIDNGSLTGMRPRVVVVMIGTNNIPLRQSAPDIARGVMTVVGDLKSRLPGARVLLLAVLPRGLPGSAARVEVGAIDRLLASKARAAGASYLDLGGVLVGAGGRFLPGVMHADLLHPAAAGYARMAARLAPEIRWLLGEAAASA